MAYSCNCACQTCLDGSCCRQMPQYVTPFTMPVTWYPVEGGPWTCPKCGRVWGPSFDGPCFCFEGIPNPS